MRRKKMTGTPERRRIATRRGSNPWPLPSEEKTVPYASARHLTQTYAITLFIQDYFDTTPEFDTLEHAGFSRELLPWCFRGSIIKRC